MPDIAPNNYTFEAEFPAELLENFSGGRVFDEVAEFTRSLPSEMLSLPGKALDKAGDFGSGVLKKVKSLLDLDTVTSYFFTN